MQFPLFPRVLMRPLAPVAALAFLTAVPARADQPAATPVACQKPDDSLIKSRGGYAGQLQMPGPEKIALYNAQGAAFNDCMKKLIENNNAEMDRIRGDGNTAIRQITDSTDRQTKDIANKIGAALADRAPSPQSDPAGEQFPDADCVASDRKPASARHGAKQDVYSDCVKRYISQASAEIRQITFGAEARIKTITDTANARIGALHTLVHDAIASANDAAATEVKDMRGTPLEINPGSTFKNGVEGVIVEGAPPQVAETPKGDGDPHAIICRKPQQLPDSRLMGPEICKRNRVWASLYKAGEDISSDGRSIVSSEKSRTTDRAALACVAVKVPLGPTDYYGYFTNQVCN